MLSLPFVPAGRQPLYLQLYQYIRSEIEAGHLVSGEKLPSKRQLAKQLKLSVVTVEGAYSQLVAEGYLESRDRSGYYVLPVAVRPELAAQSPVPNVPPLQDGERHYRFDFATSGGDPSSFPFSTWAKLSREVLSSRDQALLSAAHPQGVPELREAIVRHLYQFRGIRVSPEQVIVGAGSEFLSTLLVQLLGNQGGYALEDPGYGKIARIFQANGARVCPIPLDGQGLRVDRLEESGARVVHITPSHHFPLGTVMPISRRIQLLEWAGQGVWTERAGSFISTPSQRAWLPPSASAIWCCRSPCWSGIERSCCSTLPPFPPLSSIPWPFLWSGDIWIGTSPAPEAATKPDTQHCSGRQRIPV